MASIKPSDPATHGHTSITNNPRNGRFIAEGVTVKNLVGNAYGDTRLSRIEGGPKWTDSERYDIEAKGEIFSNVDPYTMSDRELMAFHDLQQARLRALLKDRFQLKLHRLTRELPVYVLVVGKGGPKLQPAKDPHAHNRGTHTRDGHMIATALSMESLAANLSGQTGRVVIDKTGLIGCYDFVLTWTPDQRGASLPDDHPPAGESGPSIFTAVRSNSG